MGGGVYFGGRGVAAEEGYKRRHGFKEVIWPSLSSAEARTGVRDGICHREVKASRFWAEAFPGQSLHPTGALG